MQTTLSIPDVSVFRLQESERGVIVLRDEDHLLRRFGQFEIVNIKGDEHGGYQLRAVADEIWAILEGEAKVELVDLREGSPSFASILELELHSEEKQGVLVPFDVASRFRAESSAKLAKVSTHMDGEHPEDESLSAEEMEKWRTRSG